MSREMSSEDTSCAQQGRSEGASTADMGSPACPASRKGSSPPPSCPRAPPGETGEEVPEGHPQASALVGWCPGTWGTGAQVTCQLAV